MQHRIGIGAASYTLSNANLLPGTEEYSVQLFAIFQLTIHDTVIWSAPFSKVQNHNGASRTIVPSSPEKDFSFVLFPPFLWHHSNLQTECNFPHATSFNSFHHPVKMNTTEDTSSGATPAPKARYAFLNKIWEKKRKEDAAIKVGQSSASPSSFYPSSSSLSSSSSSSSAPPPPTTQPTSTATPAISGAKSRWADQRAAGKQPFSDPTPSTPPTTTRAISTPTSRWTPDNFPHRVSYWLSNVVVPNEDDSMEVDYEEMDCLHDYPGYGLVGSCQAAW
jgi:hypothetical protein